MSFLKNRNSALFSEVEKHLSEKLGQKIVVKSSKVLGGGCINNASKLETNHGTFFLKWNSDCSSDMFLREAESLEELRKASDGHLIIPRVFAKKEVDDLPGFLVLEYLEPGYGKGNQDEILGRGLAVIHKFASEKFGFYHNNYCGSTLQNNTFIDNWPEFFRDSRLGFLMNMIEKERPLPNDKMILFERLLNKIDNIVSEDSKPALIHGDLWSGNYMNTVSGPALIDPASYYADREMEFGIITMFGGFSNRFYSAYNEVFPLLPDWRERNPLYKLYHVLNHYYLFGGGYLSQALEIARKYL